MSAAEVVRLKVVTVAPVAAALAGMGAFAVAQSSWPLRMAGVGFLIGALIYVARACRFRLTIADDAVEVRSLKGTLHFKKGLSTIDARRVAAGLTGTGTVLVLKDSESGRRIGVSLLDFRRRERAGIETKIRKALGHR